MIPLLLALQAATLGATNYAHDAPMKAPASAVAAWWRAKCAVKRRKPE